MFWFNFGPRLFDSDAAAERLRLADRHASLPAAHAGPPLHLSGPAVSPCARWGGNSGGTVHRASEK